MKHDTDYNAAGLVPNEELNKAAERRMNVLMLTLFAVVMAAVYGAFLVTNRQWSEVRTQQKAINLEFEDATQRLKKLQELEQQQQQMIGKAVLASSLIERVPRSILLAELINRMPARLSVLELDLHSEEFTPPKPKGSKDSKTGRLNQKPERAKTKEQAIAEAEENEIEPKQYLVSIYMTGAAPNDTDVSSYMTALSDHPLLSSVRLEYSEAAEISESDMRKFRIAIRLSPSADVRRIDPLIVHRSIGDPMSEGQVTYGGDPAMDLGDSALAGEDPDSGMEN